MAEAAANLARGPVIDSGQWTARRYAIATMFEDARDLTAVDPDRARTLALQALTDAIDWWFPAHGFWRPRTRSLLVEFERHHPDLGVTARQAVNSSDLRQCLNSTATVLTSTIGATGFFPWESAPEPVIP
jgi:hypothetical protein